MKTQNKLSSSSFCLVLTLAGCGMETPGEQNLSLGASEPQITAATATPPAIAGCQVFPSDNPWNQNIASAAVDPNSAAYIASMDGGSKFLHPDFGSDPSYGIPWITVSASQPEVPMSFAYADESNPGPYPFPPSAPVEQGGDAHVLVVDSGNCNLYETYLSQYVGPGWQADAGAVFNLNSDALRPDGWTSADAAGLPILPGLVRRSEVLAGQINHALRFTVQHTQHAYVHPATHYASSSTSPALPPMGLRVRLKASFNTASYTGNAKVILTALKNYGMFVADNGSDWFISGETNTSWDDDDLNQLKHVPASAFEVVKLGTLHTQ